MLAVRYHCAAKRVAPLKRGEERGGQKEEPNGSRASRQRTARAEREREEEIPRLQFCSNFDKTIEEEGKGGEERRMS